jgi:predicted MFS family arabinose efflux permease
VGAGGGGVLLSRSGFAPLPWAALGWLALALTLSLWATRRMRAAHA